VVIKGRRDWSDHNGGGEREWEAKRCGWRRSKYKLQMAMAIGGKEVMDGESGKIEFTCTTQIIV